MTSAYRNYIFGYLFLLLYFVIMANEKWSNIGIDDKLKWLIVEWKIDFQRIDLKGEISTDLLLSFLLADTDDDRLRKNILSLKNIVDIKNYISAFSMLTQARIYSILEEYFQSEAMYLSIIQNKEEWFGQAYFALIDMYLEDGDYESATNLYSEACTLGKSNNDQALHTNIRVYGEEIGRLEKSGNRKDYNNVPSSTD